MVKETDLYPPVKAYLQGQGYDVKAEVGAADLVALRGAEAPVIVELKTRFSLALFHQGVERLALADLVYLAVPRGQGRGFGKALTANIALCRRLGLGLLTVRLRDGFVEAHCDPGPYRPRVSKPKQQRLLREFSRRVGDPNTGGATRIGHTGAQGARPTPAAHAAVRLTRARAVTARGRELGHVGDARQHGPGGAVDGQHAVGRAVGVALTSIPKLQVLVVAPAQHVAVLAQGAAVLRAEGEGHDAAAGRAARPGVGRARVGRAGIDGAGVGRARVRATVRSGVQAGVARARAAAAASEEKGGGEAAEQRTVDDHVHTQSAPGTATRDPQETLAQ